MLSADEIVKTTNAIPPPTGGLLEALLPHRVYGPAHASRRDGSGLILLYKRIELSVDSSHFFRSSALGRGRLTESGKPERFQHSSAAPPESFSGAARRAIRCRLSKTQGQGIIYQPHQQASPQLLVIQIVAELDVPSEYPGPGSRVTTTL